MEVTTWAEALWYGPRTICDALTGTQLETVNTAKGGAKSEGGSATTWAETCSERRASLETVNAEADPAQERGRPPTGRGASDTSTGWFSPGSGVGTCGRWKAQQHGKPCRCRARGNRSETPDRATCESEGSIRRALPRPADKLWREDFLLAAWEMVWSNTDTGRDEVPRTQRSDRCGPFQLLRRDTARRVDEEHRAPHQ